MTNEAQDAGNYSIEQHRANVVAMGDGEKPFCYGPFCADCTTSDDDDCNDCPEAGVCVCDYTTERIEFGQAWNREQHADAEAAAKHAAIMARITRILSAVASRPVGLPAADEYYKEVGYFFE